MQRDNFRRARLMCSAAAVALVMPALAHAEAASFNIPAQSLGSALKEFSLQSQYSLVAPPDIVDAKTTAGVTQSAEPEIALAALLQGTGLSYRRDGDTFLIVRASDPQSGSAAGDGAEGTVQALIVTAQKREENIQDVPIAMSAFTQEALERSQVAGGPDLMTQVPNMTFTKTNFTSYSIQLRGIGTQAISATTDPAVAVAFNNTPFVRNRFFEQEFYDLQRVEVLRGPQGTLYGRNATAGVVNLISQKPKFTYEGKLSADVANYSSSRLEGMLNIPLVDDKVALRIAGAWTKRDGYDTNQITGNQIDGRDLWSTRASLRFTPTDRIDANLVWEHFQEDDDRVRSGKQLCKTHDVTSVTAIFPGADPHVLDGATEVFETTHLQTLPEQGQPLLFSGVQGTFSQGCKPASLYSPDSFETPNGLSVPYYTALSAIGLPIALDDPYVSRTQSHDLRMIESTVDPVYKAKSDIVEIQIAFDVSDDLTLNSETAYGSDRIFSMEDFNRFNTAAGAWLAFDRGFPTRFVTQGILSPEGVFCDPQIGCADRLVGIDVSTAKSVQFSEELRLASNFSGPFNFSLGGNFLRYDTEDKYYVMFNSLTMYAAGAGTASATDPYVPGVTDNAACLADGMQPPSFDRLQEVTGCVYIDPNPITSLNDQGHNYFLSRNPYKLISYAVFGEAYYNITDALKLTAGLRWTVDKKEAPRIPSWVLSARNAGYPVANVVEQEWREPTGRLTLDWKPDLSFTDQTLLYASFAHGYKAGGANPPPAGLVMYCASCVNGGVANGIVHASATEPQTFEPEFVNAFEVGSKNTLLDGKMTVNLAAFYYDYQGYQISQIVNRSAVNLNFDAKIWGLEVETDWRPLENLRLGLKGGYEKTRVADGMKAIDTMDRTAGRPGWVTVSPFPTFPSNCILPAFLFAGEGTYYNGSTTAAPHLVNLGNPGGGGISGCELAYIAHVDPVTGLPYVPNPTVASVSTALLTHPGYVGWDPTYDYGNNNGEGFFKDLSGNDLPNAPHFTATLTGDYTIPLPNSWLATLHTDFYYQSEAWTRIFNTPGYDKLKAYTNVNLAAIFTNDDLGWKIMAYVKNIFDRDSITGAFLNSDDTGLTTNVFLTEPRLYGLRVTKDFTGGPWWTGANPNHTGPYPLTIEIAGQVQRQDGDYATLRPTAFDNFPSAADPTAAQHRKLDWGDGRQLKLTYRPGASWKVMADFRYGRANTETARVHSQVIGAKVCGLPLSIPLGRAFCDPTYSAYGEPPGTYYSSTAIRAQTVNADSAAYAREEHLTADFAVGKDVGLGLSGMIQSSVELGLRYARIRSRTEAVMSGIPSEYLPEGWFVKYTHHTRYEATLAADREFAGLGPLLTWNAAASLLGNEDKGRLIADWSIGAGTLFGKQKASTRGHGSTQYFSSFYFTGTNIVDAPQPFDIAVPDREKSKTVPVIDLSLGLSYEIQRVKVGAGYRWERYFDALDTGYTENHNSDRTIDGPYFKIAVGFGG